jgi:hypothetical protein
MKNHGKPISFVRGDQPKEESEGIENRRLKMGPKRNPPENIGVPEGYGVMKMYLIEKKLFDGEVKPGEIVSYQTLS